MVSFRFSERSFFQEIKWRVIEQDTCKFLLISAHARSLSLSHTHTHIHTHTPKTQYSIDIPHRHTYHRCDMCIYHTHIHQRHTIYTELKNNIPTFKNCLLYVSSFALIDVSQWVTGAQRGQKRMSDLLELK